MMKGIICDREWEVELDACLAWLLSEPGSLSTASRVAPMVHRFEMFLRQRRGLPLVWLTPHTLGDVPPLLWSRVVGIGHAPEMKETPRCLAHMHPNYAAASLT